MDLRCLTTYQTIPRTRDSMFDSFEFALSRKRDHLNCCPQNFGLEAPTQKLPIVAFATVSAVFNRGNIINKAYPVRLTIR